MDAISKLNRDILFSFRPKYASKILDGQKTIELRRKFPAHGAGGAMALIYSSSPVCVIVGDEHIKCVVKLPIAQIWKHYGAAACISKKDFYTYFSGLKFGFAILFDRVLTLQATDKCSLILKRNLGLCLRNPIATLAEILLNC